MAHITNVIPSADPFLGRSDDLAELLGYVERQTKAGKLPLICIEGLPLVGKSVFAGELAKQLGKPIWVGVSHGALENTISIFGHIGEVLQETYSDQTVLNLLNVNFQSNLPDTVTFPNVANIAAVLNSNDYVLCIDNFHKIKKDGDISFFLNQIRLLIESAEINNFRAIILTSEAITGLDEIYGYPLLGFSRIQDTRDMIQANDFSLPVDQLKLLHEKTEGYPGLINLFLSYLSTLDRKDEEAALADLFTQLKKLHEMDQVKRLFLNRINANVDEIERRALAVLSVLRQPFKSEIGVAVLENSGVNQASTLIYQLWEKLFLNSRTGNKTMPGVYYLHSLLRDYFGGERNSKRRMDNNASAAAVFIQAGDFLSAAYHFQEAGRMTDAANMFTREPYRGYVHELGLTRAIDVLQRFKPKDFGRHSETWIDLCIILGDTLELSSQYRQALEVYGKALDSCENKQSLCGWRLIRRIGWINTRLANWDEAKKAYEGGIDGILTEHEGKPIPEKVETELARFRSQLGHLYFKLFDYPKAIDYCSQGLQYFENLLPKAAEKEKHRVIEYCAQAHQYLGLALLGSGNYEQAEICFTKSLELYQAVGNLYAEGQILLFLGSVQSQKSPNKQIAFDYFEEALKIGEKYNSPAIYAEFHWRRGQLFSHIGSFHQAEEEFASALVEYGSIEDTYHSAKVHNSIGNMKRVQGELSSARPHWEEAKDYFESTNLVRANIAVIGNLAYLKKVEGDFEGARADWERAQSESKRIKALNWEANFNLNQLELDLFVHSRKKLKQRIEDIKNQTLNLNFKREHIQARYVEALSLLDDGNFPGAQKTLNELCGDGDSSNFEDSMRAYFTLPETYLLNGDLNLAEKSLANAIQFTQEREHFPHIQGRLLRVMGLLGLFQDDLSGIDHLDASATIFKVMGAPLYEAGTLFKAGRLLYMRGKKQKANEYFERCLPFFIKSGAAERVRIIREMQK